MPEPDPTRGLSPLTFTPEPYSAPAQTYSQWSSAAGAGVSDPLTSYVGYADYQRGHYLATGELDEEVEQSIQSGLAGVLVENNLTTQEELPQYLAPRTSSSEQDAALVQRAFGNTAGAEYTQALSDGSADESTLRKQLNDAKTSLVETGQLSFARLTNDEGAHEIIGGGLDSSAFDTAVRDGALSYADAYMVAQGLKKSGTTGETYFERRANHKLRGELDKLVTSGTDNYTKDAVDTVSDFLKAEDKGDTSNINLSSQIALVRRDLARQYGEENQFDPEALRSRYSDDQIRQSLEETAISRLNFESGFEYHDDVGDEHKNIRITERGNTFVHPSLMMQKERFERAIASDTRLSAEQRLMAQRSRDVYRETMFSHYDKMLTETNATSDEWLKMKTAGRVRGAADVDILDAFLMDGDNYSSFSNKMGAVAASVWDAVAGIFAGVGAIVFKSEGATNTLVEIQRDAARRQEVASLFGKDFGFGMDVATTIAPMVADVAATALLSSFTLGAGGAAYLTVKTGASVTAKGLVKNLTGRMMLRKGLAGGTRESAEEVAERLFAHKLISSASREASEKGVMDAINAYNKVVSNKLFKKTLSPAGMVPQFLGAANRQAGSSYATIYSSLPEDMTHDEKHDHAFGYAMLSGTITGLITAAFMGIGRGGFESAFLARLTPRQSRQAMKHLVGAADDLPETVLANKLGETFGESLKQVSRKAFPEFLKSGMEEFFEEGFDEFINSFVMDIALDEDTPMIDKVMGALHAGAVGGVIGSGAAGLRSGLSRIKGPRGEYELYQEEQIDAALKKLEESGSPLSAEVIRDVKEFMLKDARDRDAATAPTLEVAPAEEAPAEEAPTDDIPAEALDNATTPEAMEEALNRQLDEELDAQSEEPMTASSAATAGGADTKPLRKPTSPISNVLEQLAALSNRVKVRARKFTPAKSSVKFTRGQFIEDENTSAEVTAFNKAVLDGVPLVLESGKNGMPERTELPEGYYEGKTQLLNELIAQKYPAIPVPTKGTKAWQGVDGEKGRVDANGIGEFDNVPPTVVAMLRAGIPVKAPAADAKDVNPSFIYDTGGDFIIGVRINTGEGGVKLVRLNRVESPLPDFEENLQRASAVLNLFKSTGTVPSEDIEGAAKELADALDADIATNATASLEVEANLALRLLDLLKDLDGTAGTTSPDQTAYADPTDTAVEVLMNRLALWVPAGQAKQQAADTLAKNLPITVDPKTNPDGVLKAFLRDFVMNDAMLTRGEFDLSAVTDRVKRRYTVIQNTHRNADASQYPDAPYTAKLTDSKVAATIDSRAVDVVPNNILQASADLDASPPLREALNKALDALGVTTPEKLSSDAALGVLLRNDLMRNPQAPAPEVLAFYEAAKAATLKGNYRALRLLGRWTDTVDGDLRLDWEFVSDIKAGAEAVIGSQMSDDQTVTLINAVRNESLTLYSRSRPTSANAKRAVIANGNEVERLELESDDPASVIKAFKKVANDKRASKESRTAAKLLLRNKNLIMGVEFRIRKSGNGYAGKYIRYDDGTHAVELYLDGHGAGGVEGVLLHEYVHALTAVVLTAPDSSLTPAQRAARDELIAVFEESEAAVIASDNSAFAAAVENVSEFVAHVFTSPEFQAFLKTHKTADTQTNFFQRIMDSILRFLAVKATMDKPTLHRDALAAVTGFTDTLTKTGRDSASAVAGEVAQDTRSKLDRTRRVLSEHPAISVTHGSASMETFDQLSNDFMGTGEGAQMNGWGTYLGDIEEITRQYQDQGASRSIRVVYKNNRHTENLGATMRRLVQSRMDASAKYGENSPQYKYASKVELEAYLLLRGLRNAARDRKASTDTEEKAQADFEEYLADIRSAILGSQYPELGVIYRALSDVENIQDIEYSTGTHYRVDIELETDELLEWDRALDEQSLYIQMAIGSSDNPSIRAAYDAVFQTEQLLGKQVGIATGAKFYRALADELGSTRAASQLLASIGIRGNRFFDGDTRGRAESQLGANEDSANYAIPENPTYNYVIFDDSVLTTTTIEDPHGNEQQLLRLRTQTGSQEGFAPPTEEERQEADRLMLMMGNVFARFGVDFTFEWGEGGGAAYYDVASKKVVVEKLSVIATMREVGGLGAIEQVLLGIAREESGHRASRKGISKKMFKAAMDELSGKEYLDISENYFGGVDPDRSKRKYVEQVLAGEEVSEADSVKFGLPNNPEGMKEYLLEEKLRMDWQRRRYGYTTEETYNFYKDKPNATQVVIRYLKGLINRFQEYIKVYGDDSALAEAVNELVEQTNAMYGAQRIPRMDFNPDEPDEFVQQLASQIGQLSMTPRADSRLERVVESVEQSRRALYDVSKEVEPNEPVPEIVLHDTKQDFDSAMDAISKGRAAQRFTETGRWVPSAGEGARGQVHINLEHASNSTVAQEVFNAVFDLRTPETEDKANAGAEMLSRMRNILLTGSRRDVEISEALDKLLMRNTLQSDTTWTNRGGEYIADLAGYAARIHSHLSKATRDRLNQWLNSFTDKFSGEPVIDSDESFISFMSSFARSAGESAGLIGVEGYVDQYSSGGVMKTLELAEEESVPLTDRPITISAGALTQQSSVGWIKGVEGAGDWFQDTNVDMVDVEKLFEKFRKDNSGRDPAVWVWMTDQLKRGEYVSPVTDGLTETLQGGVGFALDPDNQTDNRLWASGMPPKELQERIDASDFIWLATGAPMSSHNFSRGTSEVWVAELEAAMQRRIGAGETSYEILTGTKEDTKRETVTLTDGSLEEFAAIMQKYIPVLGEGLTHGAKTSWGKINTALAAAVKGKEELLGNTGARGRFAAEMFRDSMSNSLREGTRFHFVHNFLGVPTKDVVLPQVLEPFHINNENKQGDLVMLLEPEGIKVDDNFHDSYPHTVTGKVVGIPTRKFNIRDVAPQDLIDKSMELTKAGKVPSLVNQLKTLMGDSPNVYGAIKGNLTRQWMQNPLQATSIGALDKRYLELAKDEDANREELQMMVNERAVRAGYTSPKVYHGTPQPEGFTKFDPKRQGQHRRSGGNKDVDKGYFFASTPKLAKHYTNKKGVIIDAFLSLKNPYRIEVPEGYTYTGGVFTDTPTQRGSIFYDLNSEEIQKEAERGGHDGVIISGTDTLYIAFNPSAIKSTAPVTRDKDRNIIPLSQRFDVSTPDIRRTSIGAMPDIPIASQENMVGAASGVLGKLIAPETAYPQRLEYHNRINAVIIGEDGEDSIAQAIGIDSPKLLLTLPSIWIPESGIPEINPADALSGFSTREHAQLYAIIRGVVTQQNAIGGSRAKYIKPADKVRDAIESDTGGNTKLAYFLPISKGKRTEKLLTEVHRGLNGNDTAVFHRPEGLLIAHLGFDPEYTPTIFDNDTEKIAKAIGTEQFRLPTEVFYAENEFEEQGTERVQNIRDYGTGFGLVKDRIPSDITRQPSDIQRRLGDLAKDIQDVNNEFSAKGFGKAGDLPTRVGSYFQRSSIGTIADSFAAKAPTTDDYYAALKAHLEETRGWSIRKYKHPLGLAGDHYQIFNKETEEIVGAVERSIEDGVLTVEHIGAAKVGGKRVTGRGIVDSVYQFDAAFRKKHNLGIRGLFANPIPLKKFNEYHGDIPTTYQSSDDIDVGISIEKIPAPDIRRSSIGTIADSFALPTGTTPLEFEGGLLKIDGETVSAGVTEFVQGLGKYADLAIRKTKDRKGDGWSDVLLVDGLFELDLNDALALPEDFSPRTETGAIRLTSRSTLLPVGITVDSVKALKKGSGVRALRLLTTVADDLGVRLEGTANAFGTVEGEKGLSTDELIRFYKHFGFTFDKLGNGYRVPIPKSTVIKLKGFRRQFTSIGAVEISTEGETEAGVAVDWAGNRDKLIAFLEDRMNDADKKIKADVEKTYNNNPTKQDREPYLAVAFNMMQDGRINGRISNAQYRGIVQTLDPWVPNKEIPSAPSMELIKEFLEDRKLVKSVKQQAHLLLTNKQQRDLLKDGRFQVSLRLDIPAYTASVTDKKYKGAPVYVVTMYEGSSNGIVMGYAGFSYTKGVTFTTKETPEGDPVSLKTAGGKGKGTFAFVDGTLEKLSLAEFEKWRKGEDSKVLGNKSEWTEVGYNPLRSSEFVDLTEGANFLRPVASADEAINVGNRVYVRGSVKHGVVPDYDPAGARQYSSIGAIDDMFFSGVEERIIADMPAKASASQVKGILKGKVKKAEVEWLGLDEWLADRESVTRDEVMAFIDENKVHIEEVERTEGVRPLMVDGIAITPHESISEATSLAEPRYEEYTLAGGENYREFLITMPDREGLPTVLQRDYTNSHWGGTQNVVVHIRVKDRVTEDGKKVLHIEEIQSDWAGDIRHAGTRDAGEIARLERERVEFKAKRVDVGLAQHNLLQQFVEASPQLSESSLEPFQEGKVPRLSLDVVRFDSQPSPKLPYSPDHLSAALQAVATGGTNTPAAKALSKYEGELFRGRPDERFNWSWWTDDRVEAYKNTHLEVSSLADKINDLNGKIDAAYNAAPDMPFVNNYHELALKRILRRAAVEGYEGVTWSTGKSQIELYNEALRQNVGEIKWWSSPSKNVVALQWYNADAGEWIDADVALNGKTEAGLAEGKTLEDVVGGKIAKQIREGEAQGTVEGDDLSIGGHFHKLLYDQMIPTALRKLTKRWGGEVTETVVAHGDYTPQSKGSRHDVHQLLFTEGMAEGAQQVHALHTSVGAFDGTNINYGKDIVDMMNMPVFETDGYRKQAKKGWKRWLQNAFKGTLDPRVHRLLEQRDQIRRAVQHDLERWNSEMEKIIKEEYTSKDKDAPLKDIQTLSGSQENVSVHDEVKRIRKQYDAEVNALQDQLADDTISAEEFGTALDVAKEKKETLERDVLLQKRKEFRALQAATITELRKTAGGKRVILHVRSLRKTVDRLTQKLKDDYGIEGELGLTMDANMGIYLTKSYRMFTDAGWAEQVLTDPNPDFGTIRENAAKYFEKNYVRERTRQIRVDDPALSYAEAKKLAQAEVDAPDSNIGDSMMRAFVESYDKDSTLEGGVVRDKDKFKALIDSFKGRKELPAELSALLGEHTESTGYNSLLRTYMHVGIMASHQAFLNHVKQLGMDSGWIVKPASLSEEDKATFKPIKGSTTTKYDPFNVDGKQLYAPAEMVDNLKALLDPVAMGNMANAAVKTASDLTKIASRLTGLSLGAKTMGSIGFFVRNVVSNVLFFGPAQGLGWKTTGKMGGHLVKELRRRVFRMTPEERSVYYTELTALGIIGDEIRPQLFDELMSGQTTEQSLLKGMDTLLGDFPQDEDAMAKLGKNKWVKKLGKLKTLSSSVDAFYKIAMFEHELSVMEQARDARAGDKYESMSDDELKQEASIKVKMTAQSYSQAPPFIEGWSRSPLGVLFAPFLRFKMEVPRIIFNTQKLWAEEIATGNPVLVKRGRRRRRGFIGTSIGFSMAFPTALRVMLMGIGEDEDEALRDSIPEYLRTNTFFYLPTSDGGKVSLDMTFMNPFAIMADPILRFTEHMVRGEPAEGGAVFFKALIANQYLDEQIFAGAVRSTIANNNPETNRPIWESYDSPLESFGKSMVFLFNEAYAPKTPAAIAGSITKMVNGVDPVGTGDFLRSPAGAMLAELLPIKPHKIELDKQLNRFLAERRDEYNRASGRKNVLLTDNPVSPKEIKDIAIDEIEARIAINQHMMRAFRGFEGLGMTKAEIFAHAKERGVGKERLTLLFAGLMDRPMLTPPYIERMAAKGSEHIKRLRELHAEFKTHPRYIPLD